MNVSEKVVIYTDGGCVGNPGPGGYAAVLSHQGRRKEISGGYRLTTNNRMELLAVIMALETLKHPCKAVVHSDSQYVVNAINQGWAARWRSNNWRKADKGYALNPDLWEWLLQLCSRHEVSFVWVRGHAGEVENERCDVLAGLAANRSGLPDDPGYGGASGRDGGSLENRAAHRHATGKF